jgi:hypothetical protein
VEHFLDLGIGEDLDQGGLHRPLDRLSDGLLHSGNHGVVDALGQPIQHAVQPIFCSARLLRAVRPLLVVVVFMA